MSWMIPYLTSRVYNGIVFRPPTVGDMRGKRQLGEVGPSLTSWAHRELLPLMFPLWPMCIVLLGLYPYKVDY
jgi:hypothetical protein